MNQTIAIKESTPTVMINQTTNRPSDDDLDAEIAAMEAERDGTGDEDEVITPIVDEGEDYSPATEQVDKTGFEKRYGDLRTHSQKRESELNAKIAELEAKYATATAPEAITNPSTDEELAAWRDEFPETVDLVETQARKVSAERDEAFNKRLEGLEAREARIAAQDAIAELGKRHSDFNEIKNDPKYAKWLEKQTQTTQDAMLDGLNDVDRMDQALKLYKFDNDIRPAKKRGRPSAADVAANISASSPNAAPSGDQGVTYYESQVEQMSDREFDQHEDAIEAARRDGRLVMDLSAAG